MSAAAWRRDENYSLKVNGVTYNFGGVTLPLDLDGDLVSEEAEPCVDLAHHVIAELVTLIHQLGAALVNQPGQVTHQITGLSPDSETLSNPIRGQYSGHVICLDQLETSILITWKHGTEKLKPSTEYYVVANVLHFS